MARDETGFELPSEPIHRVTQPMGRFLHVEAASGVVLLAAAVLAFAAANSGLSEAFLGFWKTKIGVDVGGFVMSHTLKHWVSDGLMAIFFFVVGLEVKRELVLGELRSVRQAALPIAAAIGGMAVPAAVYLALVDGPATRGWGIPMATDIAFVVGCLAVLGSRVPQSLRVMLLSLAIADDIGAILVIAIGYTTDLSLAALGLGFAGLGLVLGMRLVGVRAIPVYAVVGTGVWVAFHESGVHATLAGVILGLMTPTGARISDSRLSLMVERAAELWRGDDPSADGPSHALRRRIAHVARESMSPLPRLEKGLHPWSAFLIIT
ncbi:MAG: Na+/H+ antiporter NhaA, partial [Myxococcales bacterium]|nr:Na+/H+ antiporter NhaA [Myxococcales bacterium]